MLEIIFGIIILIVGGLFLRYLFGIRNLKFDHPSQGPARTQAIFCFILFLIGGLILLIRGVEKIL